LEPLGEGSSASAGILSSYVRMYMSVHQYNLSTLNKLCMDKRLQCDVG
jgi:hypothetical protein